MGESVENIYFRNHYCYFSVGLLYNLTINMICVIIFDIVNSPGNIVTSLVIGCRSNSRESTGKGESPRGWGHKY